MVIRLNEPIILEIDETQEFDKLYEDGCMCFMFTALDELLDLISDDMLDIFNKTHEDFVLFWADHKKINQVYGLTGQNAFTKDLVFIPNFYNPYFKLKFGARWFNMLMDIKLAIQTEMNMDNWLENQTLFKGVE